MVDLKYDPTTGLPERFEIVRGEVVPLMPTGDIHSHVEMRVLRVLMQQEDAGMGVARGGEVGIVVQDEPPTVRGADAAFLLQDQLPPQKSSEGYLRTPPALVVEVTSPNDRASDILTKVLEYVSAGVGVIWVVDPATRTVTVHRNDGTARVLRTGERLWAPGVFDELPHLVGFLFEGLENTLQPPEIDSGSRSAP